MTTKEQELRALQSFGRADLLDATLHAMSIATGEDLTIKDEEEPEVLCQDCGEPLSEEDIEWYEDTCRSCYEKSWDEQNLDDADLRLLGRITY